MTHAISAGLTISYEALGCGEPALLLMHGWCSNRAMFSRLAPRCGVHRRTITLDWRGHGQSQVPSHDFGSRELLEDALAVIAASGAHRIVPVASSHAGWVAIELRRKLGDRVAKLVFLDWIVLDPPASLLAVLRDLQDPATWVNARDGIFSGWLAGVDDVEVGRFVREGMGAATFEMWSRAGREIVSAYAGAGCPLQALANLVPSVPALHLYAQPVDPAYLAAQQAFAAVHPWFTARKLVARSHWPALEVPDEVSAAIESFVTMSSCARNS